MTAGGRLLKYVVGLPLAFKLGLDLSNVIPPIKSHYYEDDATKRRELWNAVGKAVVEQSTANEAVRKRFGMVSKSTELTVTGTLSLGPSSLKWHVFTRCPPMQTDKEELWDKIVNYRVFVATEEVQMKLPMKKRGEPASATDDISLVADVLNDGRGWRLNGIWMETNGKDAVCIPIQPKEGA